MPGETSVTVVTMLVCSFYFACEAAGASCARHSLRPLISEGRTFIAKLARNVQRDREAVFAVIARSEATKHPSHYERHGLLRSARNDGLQLNSLGCLKIELKRTPPRLLRVAVVKQDMTLQKITPIDIKALTKDLRAGSRAALARAI